MKNFFLAFWLFISSQSLIAQPKTSDYILGYGGISLVIGSELLKSHIGPEKSVWEKPNEFDLFFRDHLKWNDDNLQTASMLSDVLAKGIAVPSVFWTPLLTDHKYGDQLLLNVQVLAATGLLVNSFKFILPRKRPYSFFGSSKSEGKVDNFSFFSGHAAFPFAVSTSACYLLQKEYPHQSGLIWTGSLLFSATSGYLRIAADKHYMSDVLAGMIIGGFTGYWITKAQSKKFFKEAHAEPSIPMIFNLSYQM